MVKFLASADAFFGCGKKVHKMRDGPTLTEKEKETIQYPLDCLDANAPKKNWFYLLQANKVANPK